MECAGLPALWVERRRRSGALPNQKGEARSEE
jgi:hypothetical protein